MTEVTPNLPHLGNFCKYCFMGTLLFSASHFMRWFRQMTGQSFIAFLNEYRLNTAAETLRTTDETVLTIASRCGFENLSYFNRAFKAHFGMTPRDYRKK